MNILQTPSPSVALFGAQHSLMTWVWNFERDPPPPLPDPLLTYCQQQLYLLGDLCFYQKFLFSVFNSLFCPHLCVFTMPRL